MHHTNGKAQTTEIIKMGQRGNFIRDPTIIERGWNPKNDDKFIYYGWAVDPTLLVKF